MRAHWGVASLILLCPLLAAFQDAPAPPRHTVSIRGMQYAPATITIKPGESVVWINNDDRDHTVSATNGTFRSGTIKVGQRFEHRFTRAGTFAYGCNYHPRMKGTVIVKQ